MAPHPGLNQCVRNDMIATKGRSKGRLFLSGLFIWIKKIAVRGIAPLLHFSIPIEIDRLIPVKIRSKSA